MKVVVLQPQLWPWPGVFEQMRLADRYVHFDDVQLPQGRSFCSRVQLKTAAGSQWLTLPVLRRSGQTIRDTRLDPGPHWREQHLKTLRQNYAGAPHRDEMMALVEEVYRAPATFLVDITIPALERVASYLELTPVFRRSSERPSAERSSRRLLELVQAEGGDTYITGHGAAHYLDHGLFEAARVDVRYMDYQRRPYPQLHGTFDPHVSILDLVANVGRAGVQVLTSTTIPWREHVERPR